MIDPKIARLEKFHLAEDEWEEEDERDPDVAHDQEREEQEWLK